jgi:hypothetical protein
MLARIGVQPKCFGEDLPRGYASRYDSWEYLEKTPVLWGTLRVLASLLDMRIPLTFDLDDCRLIGEVAGEVGKVGEVKE